MSRTRKLQNKRSARILMIHETYMKDGKMVVGSRQKGPARTSPQHGKEKRWPYNAEARKKFYSTGKGST